MDLPSKVNSLTFAYLIDCYKSPAFNANSSIAPSGVTTYSATVRGTFTALNGFPFFLFLQKNLTFHCLR